ncbi:hypothetical protein WJR50_21005 [Catalinimonas sp. 4WD22]|uniref:hypothetical protein n=1 Tax=Catalinimonas locisalis TaxID=3133978 RepID=UPI0031011D96
MLNKISFFALITIIMLGSSCQEDENDVIMLDGSWVESVDKADTLVFRRGESFFLLNRGKEERNGHLLPKYGAGMYEYSIDDDTISVRNLVSSFLGFYNTFINIEQDRLIIGDFYQKDTTSQQSLIFEKIQ